jgi:hypothetical protein
LEPHWLPYLLKRTTIRFSPVKKQAAFDVLTDKGNKAAESFGLVFELPQALRPIYEKLGINVSKFNRKKHLSSRFQSPTLLVKTVSSTFILSILTTQNDWSHPRLSNTKQPPT